MTIIFTEEQKIKTREANREVIENLKVAIKQNKVAEFFASFGFKPRYFELISILMCYEEGEKIIFSMYDYLLERTKPIHLTSFVECLSKLPTVYDYLKRDYNYILTSSIKEQTFCDSLYIIIKHYLTIPGTEEMILESLDYILKNVTFTHLFKILELFQDKSYYQDLIKTNYKNWLLITRGNSLLEFLSYLMNLKDESVDKYIETNFNRIVECLGMNDGASLIDILLINPTFLSLIQKNIYLILSNSNIDSCCKIYNDYDKKYELGIEKNAPLLKHIQKKLSSNQQSNSVIGAIVKSNQSNYIDELIIKYKQRFNADDYELISDDTWSNLVFKIGNRVLKIGWIRNNPNCPEHYRIVTPEFYEIINDNDGEPLLYIELQIFGSQEGITEQDIDDVLSDLGADDIIYIDPRGKNKDNFIVLPDDYVVVSQYAPSAKFLQKRVVVCDRDGLWKRGDPKMRPMTRY